jgi:periplasmic divalent cation tolerance protein
VTDSAVVLALTTCADEATAVALVRALVEQRVVACGTLLPRARSIYRWQGVVEDAAEVVVLLKTTVERVATLKTVLPSLHAYDVPELVVVPVSDGLPAYLEWVARETGAGG